MTFEGKWSEVNPNISPVVANRGDEFASGSTGVGAGLDHPAPVLLQRLADAEEKLLSLGWFRRNSGGYEFVVHSVDQGAAVREEAAPSKAAPPPEPNFDTLAASFCLRHNVKTINCTPRTAELIELLQGAYRLGLRAEAAPQLNEEEGFENRYTMIFAMTQDFKDILLLRKSSELYRGQWSAPGGKIEAGESEIQCAVREMKEETGLDISAPDLRLVMRFPCECDPKEGLHEIIVYGIFLPLETLQSARGQESEPVQTFSGGSWANELHTVWYIPNLVGMVIGRMKQSWLARARGAATQKEK